MKCILFLFLFLYFLQFTPFLFLFLFFLLLLPLHFSPPFLYLGARGAGHALARRHPTPHHHHRRVDHPRQVMRKIDQRMKKFARLMGVPFYFVTIHRAPGTSTGGGLAKVNFESLGLRDDGAVLAVNCVGALSGVPPLPPRPHPRAPRQHDAFLAMIWHLELQIVIVLKEEADVTATAEGKEGAGEATAEEGPGLERAFKDALRFFRHTSSRWRRAFPERVTTSWRWSERWGGQWWT